MARKRGQNEGSIYQRKDGLWTVSVSIQGKRISKYFKTQSECREWLRNTQSQIQNGLTLAGSRITLLEFQEQWLGSIRESVRSKTLGQYTQVVRYHIAPRLGSIKIKDLRPDVIQRFYQDQIESGASARTVLLIHSVLHRSLVIALKLGLIGRNPVDAVTRPKVRRKEMRVLTDDQARAFLSASKQTRHACLFHLALHTGMREGELLGLMWKDIDWVNRQIHVQRQLQRVPGKGLSFTEPKTAAGRRTIVISPTMIDYLRKHLEEQDSNKKVKTEEWKENDLIFPTKLGTPMHPTSMYKEYKALLRKTDLPDIRFHDLRHTSATLLLQQGIHPKIVQERLGHSDIGMTLNTYSHVLPSMQQDAALKLDELLTPIEVTDKINAIKDQASVYHL
jgi:integrase